MIQIFSNVMNYKALEILYYINNDKDAYNHFSK